MPTGIILLPGAFAGLTIFLGLPLVFLKQLPPSLKVLLNILATGSLIFLLFDVLSKASDPINASLDEVRTQHTGTEVFSLNVFLLVFGIGLDSVGLVYFNRLLFGRVRLRTAPPAVVQASVDSSAPPRSTSVTALAEKGEHAPRALALLRIWHRRSFNRSVGVLAVHRAVGTHWRRPHVSRDRGGDALRFPAGIYPLPGTRRRSDHLCGGRTVWGR
jgi:hypothetical protein